MSPQKFKIFVGEDLSKGIPSGTTFFLVKKIHFVRTVPWPTRITPSKT